MTTREQRSYPDVAIPPGETLAETLEALGITQAELARRAGRPVQAVSEIVRGKKEITAETALALERVLGVPQHLWLGLEAQFRAVKARLADVESLKKQAPLARKFPYVGMAKLEWVPAASGAVDRVRALLRFFGVASLENVDLLKDAVVWRKSAAVKLSPHALAAWLRQGEIAARQIETASFDRQGLREALRGLRALTREPFSIGRLRRLLGDHGVAVVIVPSLPGTGAHGAARWLGGKAVVQLSLRYAWTDIFWFTLFHEIGHLLLHRQNELFVEIDDGGHDGREAEADRFAADQLIPRETYLRFVAERTVFTGADVVRLADRVGVGPGIVVGRLHHDGKTPHSRLNDLRARLQMVEPVAR